MRQIELFRALITTLCFVTGTIAPAEPVTKPAPNKHPECEGSKVKTACNQGEDAKDFVKSRQALTPSAPTPEASSVDARKDVRPAKDGAAAEQPK